MPIPSPRKGQSQKDFISNCMGTPGLVKEYEQSQRAAICYSKWREHSKKASYIVAFENDEFAYFEEESSEPTGDK